MSEVRPFKVFSGTKTRYLAERICQSLDCPLGNMVISHFADGEFAVSFEESIRGHDVFLVQSTFPNSDNLMELLLMIDAAKRASARSIVAVIPYFGWARQDRKDKPRVSIGAKLVADLLSVAGIDRLITMDLHADQIQGFFNVPVDHLYGSLVEIPYVEALHLPDLVIATPDVGGAKRARLFAKKLGAPLVLCNKTRIQANVVDSIQIIGDVKGKDVVIVDDIVIVCRIPHWKKWCLQIPFHMHRNVQRWYNSLLLRCLHVQFAPYQSRRVSVKNSISDEICHPCSRRRVATVTRGCGNT